MKNPDINPVFAKILEAYDLPYDVDLGCRNCNVRLRAGRFVHREDYDFCSLECLAEYEQMSMEDIQDGESPR
jgi:hypothetical protein